MRKATIFSVVLIGLIAGSGFGAIRHVPGEYPRIQAAIQACEDGDTVVVAPGVYFETINFSGKDIVVTGTDPMDPKVVAYTVLNGDEDGTVVTFENGETRAAVLTGFTITGGFGTIDTTLQAGFRTIWGAGIFCNRSSPTITRNVIANNVGPLDMPGDDPSQWNLSYGAGIGCIESDAVITHNTIRGNSAYVAGALIAYLGDTTVANNVIFGNTAAAGAGVIMIQGELTNNTIVANNTTSFLGETGPAGNVYIVFDVGLQDCQVKNNIICGSTSGGGLYWEGSDPQPGSVAFNNVWDNFPGNYSTLDIENMGQVLHDGDFDMTGQAGNISADPMFLNPMNRDYHLTLESPCVNAGDPGLDVPESALDIDGEARVYAARIDIGADEYVGYVKPVALAGHDVHVLEPFEPVTLDGSGSFFYDPCGVRTFQWDQVAGPNVAIDDPTAAEPGFVPQEFGEYVFELVVADDLYSSEPDRVLVLVAGNQPPVADAGQDKVWPGGPVTLDGTGSHDPDLVDRLRYTWTQIEGPVVPLENPDSATPSFVAEAGQRYLFELVVSDGFVESEPSRVELVTVGLTLGLRSVNTGVTGDDAPHYADLSGTKLVFAHGWGNVYDWQIKCVDMKSDKFETFAGSGGSMNTQPRIDGDIVVWSGGVSFTGEEGPECTSVFVRDLAAGRQRVLRERSNTQSYGHPAVSGDKVVWVRHLDIDKNVADQWHNMPYDICGADIGDFENPTYFTVAAEVGRRDPFPYANPAGDFDDVVDISGDIVVWEGDGDIYAADVSDLDNIAIFAVCDHPARQRDPAVCGRFVVWTDERNDDGDIYGADISDPTAIREFAVAKGRGKQLQPVIDGPHILYVIGSETGGRVGLACVTRAHGIVNSEFGPELYGMAPVLDGATLVLPTGTYGPVRGFALEFAYSIFDGPVRNAATGRLYDYIQHAVAGAEDGAEIVVPAGVHEEQVDFARKAVTVRSVAPTDPAVVAATVLQGRGNVVTFADGEGAGSVLDGLTISGGHNGIHCYATTPSIRRCRVTANHGAGLLLQGQSDPTLVQCEITANGGPGLEMWAPREGRLVPHNRATIRHCLIAGNGGAGIHDGRPVISNSTIVENRRAGIDTGVVTIASSIVFFNDQEQDAVQISGSTATVTYSDVQGGWPGDGNIDADPHFVAPGQWTSVGWIAGDYHLMSAGRRWDAVSGSWVSDAVTSPCVDAGDPAADLLDELLTIDGLGANQRINMGAYGGTAEASLAP